MEMGKSIIDHYRDEINELKERNKQLVAALERMILAWNTGELECTVVNGRWWGALEEAEAALMEE